MWAIMKTMRFSSLEIEGRTLNPPDDGPQRFIPVFDTRAQAVKFNNGSELYLVELQETS